MKIANNDNWLIEMDIFYSKNELLKFIPFQIEKMNFVFNLNFSMKNLKNQSKIWRINRKYED